MRYLAGIVARKRHLDPQYRLCLLGIPSLRRPDGSTEEAVLRQAKRFAVLAYLALQESPVPRDLLLALFWPSLDTLAAHRALRQTLHFLRHKLGPAAFVSLRGSVGICPRLWHCDARALESAFNRQDWGEVMDLYGGEFLSGLHVYGVDSELELWIEEKRQQLRECAHVALWKSAEQNRSAGQEQESIRLLRRALALELFDEVLLRQLIELLHERGDRAGAIEVYERFASRLRADLEVEPAPETQTLVRSIRLAPAKESDVASAGQPDINYRNLPVPFSPLVGRRREVDLAVGTLQRKGVRILSITGAGGMGKTRVALEAAAELAPGFEGVCFVPLASASGSLHDQLVHALRLEENGRESQARVVEHLVGRRVLLVLDNFEDVLAEARALSRLLSACPGVKTLITSICPLRIPHETEQALDGLQIPAQPLLLRGEWPPNSEAVAYFQQCAESVDCRFRLTEHNAHAILRICRAVDGMPLAIALAAARLRELPVHELADHLESGVSLLGERHSTRPERHRTMAAAIQWTTQSFEPAEKELYLALSVCEGAFSLRAAEYAFGRVCNGASFWTSIEALTERGLLRRSETRAYAEMLSTVRVEARREATRLGKADSYRTILLRYYCSWLRIGYRSFCTDQEAEWLCTIDREYRTISVLLEWALRRDPVRAARLVHFLWFYWWNRGFAAQGSATIARVLKARNRLSLTSQGRILASAGNLAMRDDANEAISRLWEATELFRRLKNDYRLGWTLQSLGIALHETGAIAEATHHLQEALEIGLITRNATRIAFCQQALGKLAIHNPSSEGGEELLRSSLRSAQTRRDWSTVAFALRGLGDIALSRESYREAADYFERGKAYFESLGQKIDVAFSLERLAWVSLLQEEDSQVVVHAHRALGLFRETNYTPGVVKVLLLCAQRELKRGEAERGFKLLAGVETIMRAHIPDPDLEKRIGELLSEAQRNYRKTQYESIYRIGQSLSLDELVQLAWEEDSSVRLERARHAVQ